MMKPLKLEDPLINFNWDTLYQRYDETTRSSKFISCLKYLDFQPSPISDRNLYGHILEALRKNNNVLTIDIYSAIIYWKMYSVSISTNNKLVTNNAFRQAADQSLQKFQKVADFNKITERNPDKIIQLMKWLKNEKGLNGVGYRVASTICHFLWPNIVPIVD